MSRHFRTVFVCVGCRHVVKAEQQKLRTPGYDTVCPFCNGVMVDTGYRLRMPKKSDDRGWKSISIRVSIIRSLGVFNGVSMRIVY